MPADDSCDEHVEGILGADALEQSEPPGIHERNCTFQAEAGFFKEGSVFRIRSFHAPDVNQHFQVDVKHAHCLAMVRRDSPLDD